MAQFLQGEPATVGGSHLIFLETLRTDASIGMSGYLWGIGAAAIWSGWWTVTRLGVNDGLLAGDLAALRFAISGLLLLPLAWRERDAIRAVAPRHLFFMAIGAGAPYAMVAGVGVKLTSAGVGGAMTVGLLPVFTLFLSMLLLRERATRRLLFSIALILIGAGCVTAGVWHGVQASLGLGFFVLGALMWSGYTVALRRAGLRPLTATAVICVASLVLYTPVWFFTSGTTRLLATAPSDLLLQAFYQSILSAIGALYCFGRAVGQLGATRASVFAAIVPAFSMIIAAVTLREIPSAIEICGAALLSTGAIAAARGRPNIEDVNHNPAAATAITGERL
jgi:drug/metabolite transporter (DMT)-like permease